METSNFSTTVHAKWMLAGEHAVLRGKPAIVFPIQDKMLNLQYHEKSDIKTDFLGDYSDDIHMLFWGVVEHALELLHKPLAKLSGVFKITNFIPMGAGMGLSAALCAAVSRYMAWKEWIKESEIFTFAKKLEDIFHSESSGVDIAGAISDNGIIYTKDGAMTPIVQNWKPKWYLSYTDQVGITSMCVKKVKELWKQNPTLAARIDDNMHDSVTMAIEALQLKETQGLPLLVAAINKAHLCFTQWGLTGGKVEQHINFLLQSGAMAAKPTGSGDGGYALSLWNNSPPKELETLLISI